MGAIRDPSALISVGKAAVRQAVAVVAAQARDAWKAAKRGMVAPFASLWTGLKTIGGSIKNAAAWTWERRQGFAKIVQGATELLSLLPPPVGPVAGLVNALTYAMQGDWKNAGFGLVSAIPLVDRCACAPEADGGAGPCAIEAESAACWAPQVCDDAGSCALATAEACAAGAPCELADGGRHRLR